MQKIMRSLLICDRASRDTLICNVNELAVIISTRTRFCLETDVEAIFACVESNLKRKSLNHELLLTQVSERSFKEVSGS